MKEYFFLSLLLMVASHLWNYLASFPGAQQFVPFPIDLGNLYKENEQDLNRLLEEDWRTKPNYTQERHLFEMLIQTLHYSPKNHSKSIIERFLQDDVPQSILMLYLHLSLDSTWVNPSGDVGLLERVLQKLDSSSFTDTYILFAPSRQSWNSLICNRIVKLSNKLAFNSRMVAARAVLFGVANFNQTGIAHSTISFDVIMNICHQVDSGEATYLAKLCFGDHLREFMQHSYPNMTADDQLSLLISYSALANILHSKGSPKKEFSKFFEIVAASFEEKADYLNHAAAFIRINIHLITKNEMKLFMDALVPFICQMEPKELEQFLAIIMRNWTSCSLPADHLMLHPRLLDYIVRTPEFMDSFFADEQTRPYITELARYHMTAELLELCISTNSENRWKLVYEMTCPSIKNLELVCQTMASGIDAYVKSDVAECIKTIHLGIQAGSKSLLTPDVLKSLRKSVIKSLQKNTDRRSSGELFQLLEDVIQIEPFKQKKLSKYNKAGSKPWDGQEETLGKKVVSCVILYQSWTLLSQEEQMGVLSSTLGLLSSIISKRSETTPTEDKLYQVLDGLLKRSSKDCLSDALSPTLIESVFSGTIKNRFGHNKALVLLAMIFDSLASSSATKKSSLESLCLDLCKKLIAQPEFLHTLFSGDNPNQTHTTQQVLIMFKSLAKINPKCLNRALLPYFAAALNGTISLKDQLLLDIIKEYDGHGISLVSIGYIWGPFSPINIAELMDTNSIKVLDPADFEIKDLSRLNLDAFDHEKNDIHDRPHYDPRYILKFIKFIAGSKKFTPKDCLSLGYLSYTIHMLSNTDVDVRQNAYEVLALLFSFLEAGKFKEKQQVLMLLKAVKNSISQLNQLVPHAITTWAAHALHTLQRPNDFLYTPINKFLLSRSHINLEDVPMFLELFNSDSQEFKIYRRWVLKFLGNAFRDHLDFTIFQRRHVFEVLMCFYDSEFSDPQTKNLVLSIIHKACRISRCAQALADNFGGTSWLSSIILRQSPGESMVEHKIHAIRVLSTLIMMMPRTASTVGIMRGCADHLICFMEHCYLRPTFAPFVVNYGKSLVKAYQSLQTDMKVAWPCLQLQTMIQFMRLPLADNLEMERFHVLSFLLSRCPLDQKSIRKDEYQEVLDWILRFSTNATRHDFEAKETILRALLSLCLRAQLFQKILSTAQHLLMKLLPITPSVKDCFESPEASSTVLRLLIALLSRIQNLDQDHQDDQDVCCLQAELAKRLSDVQNTSDAKSSALQLLHAIEILIPPLVEHARTSMADSDLDMIDSDRP
eukprot:TRINITY_DN6445_c0_g1_i1.p1 TRINITY_DN6445_c0_g1~~TRINITY_DN6445_c0_g1_i1.p1  ORF type:complete len:1280 (+),score=229.38 TRINITY_DN6445_c0_g1_i1:2584-6423(+)